MPNPDTHAAGDQADVDVVGAVDDASDGLLAAGLDVDDEAWPVDPFEALVAAALDSLPTVFRDRLGTVAIVIEDEPTPAQLASVGAAGLFGLYTGVPRTAFGAGDAPLPSKITIFRGPHLRAYPTPDRLATGVADTVRHEIAHHFGISDERLRELATRERDGQRW